ncbi:MAG TPA: hypothetical protein VF657_21655 [Actinoplanes sp.]|jgi:hypothetical protein
MNPAGRTQLSFTTIAATPPVPDGCTLPTAEQPLRVGEFDVLFRRNLIEVDRVADTRLRMVLTGDGVEAQARDLCDRESRCCSFFTFAVDRHGDAVTVDVTVPPARRQVLDAIQMWATSSMGQQRTA